MFPLPQVTEPLLMGLGIAFTEPTFKRILPLLVGAIADGRSPRSSGRCEAWSQGT